MLNLVCSKLAVPVRMRKRSSDSPRRVGDQQKVDDELDEPVDPEERPDVAAPTVVDDRRPGRLQLERRRPQRLLGRFELVLEHHFYSLLGHFSE